MQTIVFQGDSITDADRSRDNDEKRGLGYPQLVTAQLGLSEPQRFRCLNRGVSGDRIVDLYARIKRDCINLRPDYLSILIGVNDVWHELGAQNGVATEKYARLYQMLLDEIRAALPQVKIMILEPYLTHGTATDPQWDAFFGDVRDHAAAAGRVAAENGLLFVPLQDVFDRALERAPASWWTQDGVHPTPYGHALIAQAWLQAFQTIR